MINSLLLQQRHYKSDQQINPIKNEFEKKNTQILNSILLHSLNTMVQFKTM